jgi:hypothetical protein
VSNILQQITKNDKNDPDLVKLIEKADKLKAEIGSKLKQTELDESALRTMVIGLAETIEKIMKKNNCGEYTNQIFTYLSNYFKSDWNISEKTNNLLYSFFADYPQYERMIVKNNCPYILSGSDAASSFDIEEVLRSEGTLPEESKLYKSQIEYALSTLNKIDFSRLPKDTCLTVSEKMSNIIKQKQHELEHNYRLIDKKGDKTQNQHKYDPYEDSPAQETASPGNKITQSLIKVRNQFDAMITQSQYMKFPSPELENELSGYFETFYKSLRFITDRKHKASLADWSNMSLATNDFNSCYANSNIKFKAPLCAKCKEQDEVNDPTGKKKIFRHIQMYSEYVMDRYDKEGNPISDPYIWRCKRCNGTERKEETMSVERINESMVLVNSLLIDMCNKSDIYKAISIYFEELIKPGRLVIAHHTSNKLLSKK